jgi:reactive intermediate/imine deaminase
VSAPAAHRAGDMLYIAGQIGIEPATRELADGFEAQLHRVFYSLKDIANASGFNIEHAVKLTLYLTDLAYFARVNEILAQHILPPFPAWTMVGVPALPRGALVEIDAILYATPAAPSRDTSSASGT